MLVPHTYIHTYVHTVYMYVYRPVYIIHRFVKAHAYITQRYICG